MNPSSFEEIYSPSNICQKDPSCRNSDGQKLSTIAAKFVRMWATVKGKHNDLRLFSRVGVTLAIVVFKKI